MRGGFYRTRGGSPASAAQKRGVYAGLDAGSQKAP
jgi:hypothetical protein